MFYWLIAIGATVGLGKLLVSKDPFSFRAATGHGIVSAGLAMTAPLILIPLPDVPLPVLFGLAAFLSSMGASTIALFLHKYLDRK